MKIWMALVLALLTACTVPRGTGAPDYAAIVAAADRSDADRQTDLRRKPERLLAFTGVRPGMKVLDMGAAGGYSTELLARVVGASGVVYAQDPPAIAEKMRERLGARLLANVVRVVRDFDDPVPAGDRDFDLVTFFFAYHDTAFMPSTARR